MTDMNGTVLAKVDDVYEFLELLNELTQLEKAQVQGIMVGMQMLRQMESAAN